MKLGMWNRLAVVGAVLSLLVLPAWYIADSSIYLAEAQEQGFTRCIEAASQRNDGTLSNAKCREIWPISGQYKYGWTEWRQAATATLIAYAAIYILIWLTVWTTRWVLRGRQANL